MSDSISTFFSAWQVTDHNERVKLITSAVSENIGYDDPRTESTITSINVLTDYVGMFSANAPGWSAKVVKTDTTGSYQRVTVAFSGMGPDGNQQTQYGQYFVELQGALIAKMVGFVGTGEAA